MAPLRCASDSSRSVPAGLDGSTGPAGPVAPDGGGASAAARSVLAVEPAIAVGPALPVGVFGPGAEPPLDIRFGGSA